MYLLKKNLLSYKGLNQLSVLLTWAVVFIGLFIFIQSCKKQDGHPKPVTQLDLKLLTSDFVAPVTLVGAPDGSKRLFVVDEIGKIWIITPDGTKMPTPFLDVSSWMVTLSPQYDERGLLGLAFHPNFKENGRFFVFYTAPPRPGGPTIETGNTGLPKTWNNLTRISEFKVSSSNPNQADMASEKVILEENHPQLNHDGGTIAFGNDGFLYISIGDGGNKDDVGPGHVNDWYKVNAGGNGQDVNDNLLGNILRIDVDHSNSEVPYSIPSDNPFVGKPGKDEIYAYGFRNPYRFSFDMGGTHQLYVGDVGQSLYEEIDVVTKGGNYGWNVKEGRHCFNTDNDLTERASCPMTDSAGNPLIDPVIELNNTSNPAGGVAEAIIGGFVYRGYNIPSLQGKYIFGVLSSDEKSAAGKLYQSTPGGSDWPSEIISLKSFPNSLGQFLKGFGQGADGELYVLTSDKIGPNGNTGKVYKLITTP